MSGFITMHREAFDHPLLRDGDRFRAWFWMVAKACWKPTPFDISGKTITLERGQFCASRAQLADAWGWSPSAVERFLTRLETEQMIGRATGQGRSIITICNYSKYQDDEPQTGQATGQATGQRSDSDRTAKEQGNKGTIEEEPIGSPSTPKAPKAPAKIAMTLDWVPGPLPSTVQELVDLWPDGRLSREVEAFRDYWIDRREKRPGWDRTFHNRIRDIHDRVLRDSHNGNRNANWSPAAGHRGPPDRRDGFTRALHDELERAGSIPASEEAGRSDAGAGGGDRGSLLTGPDTLR